MYQAFHFRTSTTILHVDKVLFHVYYLKFLHILYCYSDFYLLIIFCTDYILIYVIVLIVVTQLRLSSPPLPLPRFPFPSLRSRPPIIQLGSPGSGVEL